MNFLNDLRCLLFSSKQPSVSFTPCTLTYCPERHIDKTKIKILNDGVSSHDLRSIYDVMFYGQNYKNHNTETFFLQIEKPPFEYFTYEGYIFHPTPWSAINSYLGNLTPWKINFRKFCRYCSSQFNWQVTTVTSIIKFTLYQNSPYQAEVIGYRVSEVQDFLFGNGRLISTLREQHPFSKSYSSKTIWENPESLINKHWICQDCANKLKNVGRTGELVNIIIFNLEQNSVTLT